MNKSVDKEKTGIIYSIGKNDVNITATVGKKHKNPMISRAEHNSLIHYAPNIHILNRAVRCEQTLLYGGNLPVFAMGTTKPYHSSEPPILNLGQLNLSVIWQDVHYNFIDADTVKVEHIPNGTKWHISFDALPEISFLLYASLMEDYGIVATLKIAGNMEAYKKLKLHIAVGDFKIASRNFLANWFNELSKNVEPNITEINKTQNPNGAAFAVFEIESEIYEFFERAMYGFWCVQAPITKIIDNSFHLEFEVSTGEVLAFSGIHSSFDKKLDEVLLCKNAKEVHSAQKKAEARLKTLLDNACIKTPSKILNAGIHNAILNHDYTHLYTAWLEGGHWWNCYWTNNYQISAAISLGQYERAKEALLFFGLQEAGYTCTSAAGRAIDHNMKKDGTVAWGYDGVPYYLYQLWQYTQQTGDLSVVEAVAEHMHKNCLELMEACDPDNDGLYSWHRACNSFMYQTDHFAVPGKGASPSLMMAGDFEKFAELLNKIGKKELASFYKKEAEKTYKALKKTVWEEKDGYFLTTVDLKGTRCRSHYYTDLVFPYLYTTLEDKYKLLPLLHLKDSLCFRSELTDRLLMRVGEQKPDLFGNNNPMPVQMAEAARAYLKMGDIETGYDLMEACALANSIFTEAPGGSPERLSDFGKGEPNFMFGNPAASVAYSAIDGLFGLRCVDFGKTLEFAPALPKDFRKWSINLPYAFAEYSKNENGCTFKLKLPSNSKVKKIRFVLTVPSSEDLKLRVNGKELEFKKTPSIGCQSITAEFITGKNEIEISLEGEFKSCKPRKPIYVIQGQKVKLSLKENEVLLSNIAKTSSSVGTYYALILNKSDNIYTSQKIVVFPKPILTSAFVDLTGNKPMLKIDGSAFFAKQKEIFALVNIDGKEYKTEKILPDKQGSLTAQLHLNVLLHTLPAYHMEYKLMAEGKEIGKGILDAIAIQTPQYQYTDVEQLDLTKYLNSDHMAGVNCWRGHGKYLIKFGQTGNEVSVPNTKYLVAPVKEDKSSVRVCVLEYGRSRENFGIIERANFTNEVITGFPIIESSGDISNNTNTVLIKVGKKVGAISLLYLGEVEIRLTYETLGEFVLRYADGTSEALPITSGRNTGSIFSNYAKDTAHILLFNEAYVNDSANHYAIGCDSEKVLDSVEIRIDKEDTQLALAGMNLYR